VYGHTHIKGDTRLFEGDIDFDYAFTSTEQVKECLRGMNEMRKALDVLKLKEENLQRGS
jgi:hypothetical protein